MKKCLLLLFASSFAFISCETTEIENEESAKDLAKIENVLLLEGEEQIIAFRLLKNENKALLWRNKMNSLLKNEKLNSKQIKLINELDAFIVKDSWDTKGSKYNDLSFGISLWSSKAEQYFSKKEFVSNFISLNGKVYGGSGDGGLGGGTGDPSCDCSRSSNHCGAFWETVSCIKKKCIDDSILGCGTLLSYDCDGLCNE